MSHLKSKFISRTGKLFTDKVFPWSRSPIWSSQLVSQLFKYSALVVNLKSHQNFLRKKKICYPWLLKTFGPAAEFHSYDLLSLKFWRQHDFTAQFFSYQLSVPHRVPSLAIWITASCVTFLDDTNIGYKCGLKWRIPPVSNSNCFSFIIIVSSPAF